MEACATSLFGEPEYAGLVEVALPAMRWASLSGLCERRPCLMTSGGAEVDLLIVTCIHSGLSWAAPVESLDCEVLHCPSFLRGTRLYRVLVSSLCT